MVKVNFSKMNFLNFLVGRERCDERNDEDMACCFEKYILQQVDRDTKHLVLWVHRPQNKNWTLSPALVTIVNDSRSSLERMF